MSEMQYYVILTGDGHRAATGLARRTYAEAGPVDETLSRDIDWQPDSAIVEWEYGDLGAELAKIGEQEAASLTRAFQSRWGRES